MYVLVLFSFLAAFMMSCEQRDVLTEYSYTKEVWCTEELCITFFVKPNREVTSIHMNGDSFRLRSSVYCPTVEACK